MKRNATIVAVVLLRIRSGVESQQNIKISTISANFNAKLFNVESRRAFSTNQVFRFESATSNLFHRELSTHASRQNNDGANSHVVVSSVHVERMRKDSSAANPSNGNDGGTTSGTILSLESVVSVTFSDVGLYKATKRSPIAVGWEDKTTPNIASVLTKTVSSNDLLKILIAADLITGNATVELSFGEFDGSPDKRGVTATQTEIVSKRQNVTATQSDIVSKLQNDGWAMFVAGVMIALLIVSITSVVFCLIKKRCGRRPVMKNNADDKSCNSVHYEGDIELELATTCSGVLGLKGHHPNNENTHPNTKSYRRKRWGVSSSSKTGSTASVSTARYFGSPKTQKSGVVSASSKHPLGITSMGKLDSFLTPPKPKSDRLQIYDVGRLTRT